MLLQYPHRRVLLFYPLAKERIKNMKNTLKLTALALAFVMIAVCFVSCKGDSEPNVWDAAVYTEDTEIGEGETTFT